jgi:hypothetical protein
MICCAARFYYVQQRDSESVLIAAMTRGGAQQRDMRARYFSAVSTEAGNRMIATVPDVFVRS